MPAYFNRYIDLADDRDLCEQLSECQNTFDPLMPSLLRLGNTTYAPGKWSAREILQHIIDNERIQSYRALCMARGEQQALPGYDEDAYGKASLANRRSMEDLLTEFRQVRSSSIWLFRSMNPEMLLRQGKGGGRNLTPLALGLVLVGHQLHHMHILQERYIPLL